MTNSADPDQLASSEANWSGPTLFAKTGHVVFSKRRVNKPAHDKTCKMACAPSKTQISLRINQVRSESSLCDQWVAKDPSVLHADSEDSDQTGRMPSLIWVFAGRTCHFVGFVVRGVKSQRMTKPTIRPLSPAKTQISLYIHPVGQEFSFIPFWIAWRL